MPRDRRQLVLLVSLWVLASMVPRGALSVEPPDDETRAAVLRPGLVAEYRSRVDATARLTRIDTRPALWLPDSSPHPRLPAGPFDVTWQGVLQWREGAAVAFDAECCGELQVAVDGVTVLSGGTAEVRGRIGPGRPLDRPPGFYELVIRYRSSPDLPARLQLGWSADSFARERLPPWYFWHLPDAVTHEVQEDLESEQGRTAVGRWGCARCHPRAFPGVAEPPPGPSLHDSARRLRRDWLLKWLEDPAGLRPGTTMPALFTADRRGFVQRWLVTERLLATASADGATGPAAADPAAATVRGDHRLGRRQFIGLGCPACHQVPDVAAHDQPDLDRWPLLGLADRYPAGYLARFLRDPQLRYPDERMPRLPLDERQATDVEAYLRLWSAPREMVPLESPTVAEIDALVRELGGGTAHDAGALLIQQQRCAACHAGLEGLVPPGCVAEYDVPLAADASGGCLDGTTGPRFAIDDATRRRCQAYLRVAVRDQHDSPHDQRRRLLARLGCVRCHARDSDRPPALEVAGGRLGGAWLQRIPYQRAPRLTDPLDRLTPDYLVTTVREGAAGLRSDAFTYRMPAFGARAEAVLRALAEIDGDVLPAEDVARAASGDPTAASLYGPQLVGFQGYSCVACHVWNGRLLGDPDPGAVGPDLTRTAGRLRRDWFERFVENPARFAPGTPMPSVFQHGQPALLRTVWDGDAARQRETLWEYLSLGPQAPSPQPPPPLPLPTPRAGEPPLVAQIPLHGADRPVIESLTMLTADHDLVIYDVGRGTLVQVLVGGQLHRRVQGRLRTLTATGRPLVVENGARWPWQVTSSGDEVASDPWRMIGYDRSGNALVLRSEQGRGAPRIAMTESCQVEGPSAERRLVREVRMQGVPPGTRWMWDAALTSETPAVLTPLLGAAERAGAIAGMRVIASPDASGQLAFRVTCGLPPPEMPPPLPSVTIPRVEEPALPLERPGYRAVPLPRPLTASGEDLVMPSALAVHPRDGRLFVASMKQGEIFVVSPSRVDGQPWRVDDYARGLFQEAYSMWADDEALFVLHRRNLSRLSDTDGDGRADRCDRVALLPHGIADTYDYAYGLARDRWGAFVFSFAPYANQHLPGSGGAVRIRGEESVLEPLAFGLRNPLGWCVGPEGEIFCTDNQGEWVAANKLCHVAPGSYHGFPNPSQPEHASRPVARPAIWVPYGWAQSINGVAMDTTDGKWGPFAGQIFMAELMFGGAIVRANLERVRGVYQGACFPFWGRGLLGPLCLAFDPQGALFVGSITEPGWMAQPDRGALYRIEPTGELPFEMLSLHARPQGFRIQWTRAVDRQSAADPAAYQLEHYRYEYSGAYGSPELDRTRATIRGVRVAPDGKSVELETDPLVQNRVYLISVPGVRSASGEPPLFPSAAYTLNEIPDSP